MYCAIRPILLALMILILPGQISAAKSHIAELKAVSGQVWLIVPPSKTEVLSSLGYPSLLTFQATILKRSYHVGDGYIDDLL